MLNPVGMLCFDQPIAQNIPPFPLPISALLSIGSLVAAAKAAAAAAAANAVAAAQAAAVAAAACHNYLPRVIAAGPRVVTGQGP